MGTNLQLVGNRKEPLPGCQLSTTLQKCNDLAQSRAALFDVVNLYDADTCPAFSAKNGRIARWTYHSQNC